MHINLSSDLWLTEDDGTSGAGGEEGGQPDVPVTGICLKAEKKELSVGETMQIMADISPADASNQSLTWTSSDSDVASVSPDGAVTAVSLGVTTITASATDGSCISATLEVSVVSIAESPVQNPVHHCAKQNDGSDYTDWSYVYFGSYPQTEVIDEELTEDIVGADYGVSGDAWVNGTKYRRIRKSDTNNNYYDFGSSTYRYFKWERIKWRVLKNDGETLFVVADQGLDCKNYNEEDVSVTWENCTLRQWLNNDFYGTAFSSNEQGAIVSQTVVNEDNPNYDTEGGSDTADKVYLLSIGEAENPDYGFCEDYSTTSASRLMQASDYAHARGVYVAKGVYEGNCFCWLRSPGSTGLAAYVFGSVSRYGYGISSRNNACVPAMHVNLSSDLWLIEDDGTSGAGGEIGQKTPENPAHICSVEQEGGDGNAEHDTGSWSYIYFGSYPQTEVTGAQLMREIINAPYNETGDAWVGGVKYRRISKSDTNYDKYFGNRQYRYFKWERIRWRVLQKTGDDLFLMADSLLDSKYYHSSKTNVTWESSALRKWLNQTFYNTAFSGIEQGAVLEQTVANEDNTLNDVAVDGGNDTKDKVYLLSIREAATLRYGFCSYYGWRSVSRRMHASDYAHAIGAGLSENFDNSRWWWLRSPGIASDSAAYIGPNGQIIWYSEATRYNNVGVVPAMHVSLSSGQWLSEDDGTSGSGGGNGNTPTRPATNPGGSGTGGNGSVPTQTVTNPGGNGSVPTQTVTNPGGTGNKKTKRKMQKINAKSKKIQYKSKNVSLGAYSSGNGTLSYTSGNKKVATVDAKGRVTAKGYGKTTITIKAAATGQYLKASKKITVTVVPRNIRKLEGWYTDSPQYKLWYQMKADKTISGYEFWVSSSVKFKKNKTTKIVRKGAKNRITIKNVILPKGMYYVKIRPYKTVKKKTYLGNWSDIWNFTVK